MVVVGLVFLVMTVVLMVIVVFMVIVFLVITRVIIWNCSFVMASLLPSSMTPACLGGRVAEAAEPDGWFSDDLSEFQIQRKPKIKRVSLPQSLYAFLCSS